MGSKDKEKMKELETLEKVLAALQSGKSIRLENWKAHEVDHFRPLGLLTAKPVVYLVNMSKPDYLRKKNSWLPKIKEWVDQRSGEKIILLSVPMEQELIELSKEEREKFLKENNTKSQIQNAINTGYHALNLIHFFTAGEDEVKAWTIWNGYKAPQAAGTIHSDFEKGFICASIMSYEDLVHYGTEAKVKDAGKMRQEGKTYTMLDGDIAHFKFNT
jgi:obg-like ATPase 1